MAISDRAKSLMLPSAIWPSASRLSMTLDGQHDDVRRLAGPHQLRRFDAAHGSDIDPYPVRELIGPSQISQDVSGRHRRQAGDPPAHVSPPHRARDSSVLVIDAASSVAAVSALSSVITRLRYQPSARSARRKLHLAAPLDPQAWTLAMLDLPPPKRGRTAPWRSRSPFINCFAPICQAPGMNGRRPHAGIHDQLRLHRVSRIRRGRARLSRRLAHEPRLQGAHFRLRHQDQFARPGSADGEASRLRGGERHRRFDRARRGRRRRGGVLRRYRRSGARGGAGGAAGPGEGRAVLRLQFLRAPNQGPHGYGRRRGGRTLRRRRGDGAGSSAPASNPALDQRPACRSRGAGARRARHVGKDPRRPGRRRFGGQNDPLDHHEGARGAGLRMRAGRAEGGRHRDRARFARRHLPRLRLEEALGLYAGAGHDPRRPARRGNA